MLAGFFSATEATLSAEKGSVSTPLIGAASMATAALARLRPSSTWASKPPNECPMTTGFAGSASMIFA